MSAGCKMSDTQNNSLIIVRMKQVIYWLTSWPEEEEEEEGTM
jgi:hypothetical protein